MSGDQKHQYHLVEPSPWPAVGSAAGFTLVLGLTMFMHEYAYSVYILGAGVLMVLATMFFWWRDVVREAEYQGHHTPIVQIGMRYGMMLFISSEVMFFVAFLDVPRFSLCLGYSKVGHSNSGVLRMVK